MTKHNAIPPPPDDEPQFELFAEGGERIGLLNARHVLGQLGEWLATKADLGDRSSAATSVRTPLGYIATLEVHKLHDDRPTLPDLAAAGRRLIATDLDELGEDFRLDLEPDSDDGRAE